MESLCRQGFVCHCGLFPANTYYTRVFYDQPQEEEVGGAEGLVCTGLPSLSSSLTWVEDVVRV